MPRTYDCNVDVSLYNALVLHVHVWNQSTIILFSSSHMFCFVVLRLTYMYNVLWENKTLGFDLHSLPSCDNTLWVQNGVVHVNLGS